MIAFPEQKFSVIYPDPPWQFRDKAASGRRGAGFKYDLMDIDSICALPVQGIAADHCLLAMWWVDTQPLEAVRVCEAWGFRLFKMFGFVWEKTTKNGKEHFGMGNLTRSNAEAVLFGVRGKISEIRKSRSVRQIVRAPVGRHSEKPDEVRQRLVTLCGDVPRIELFARQSAPGWHSWGNQLQNGVTEP